MDAIIIIIIIIIVNIIMESKSAVFVVRPAPLYIEGGGRDLILH